MRLGLPDAQRVGFQPDIQNRSQYRGLDQRPCILFPVVPRAYQIVAGLAVRAGRCAGFYEDGHILRRPGSIIIAIVHLILRERDARYDFAARIQDVFPAGFCAHKRHRHIDNVSAYAAIINRAQTHFFFEKAARMKSA